LSAATSGVSPLFAALERQ